MPLDCDAVVRVTRAKGHDDQYNGHCPTHEDERGSLSITRNSDGTATVYCHAGKCDQRAVFKALIGKGCGRDSLASRNGSYASEWVWSDYTDENSVQLYQSGRQDHPRKKFTQRRPDGMGGYIYKLDGVRRVLYKLPALLAGIAEGKSVVVVEGEKHVNRLTREGFLATTFSGGAGALKSQNQPKDWPEHFRGVDVCVLGDNDEPGKAHACRVGRALLGIAKSVRVVKALPGVGYKGDVLNWLGGENDAAALRVLMNAQPEYTPLPGDDTEASYEAEHTGDNPAQATAEELPNGSPDESPKSDARAGPVWLAEYLARPELLAPPAALVPRLFLLGRTSLISAREKIGKSTLLAQAAAALTRGGVFLGDLLALATVLWYAIDEPLADVVQRFKHFGADPRRLAIVTEPPTALEMQADIEATGARVVVVDTLTELWGGRKIDENAASEVAPRIRPYVALSRALDVALMLVHHTSKSGTEYRGSGHLGAAVDVIITLRPVSLPTPNELEPDPTREDTRRLLIGRGRNVNFHERLTFDGSRYVLGDAAPTVTLRLRVLRALLAEPASMSKLAGDLKVRKESVLNLVPELMGEGLVVQTGDTKKPKCELTEEGKLAAIGAHGVPASVPDPFSERLAGTDAGTGPESLPNQSDRTGTGGEPVGNRSGTAGDLKTPRSVPEKNPRGLEREPVSDPDASERWSIAI